MVSFSPHSWLMDPQAPFIVNPDYIDFARGHSKYLPIRDIQKLRYQSIFVGIIVFISLSIGIFWGYEAYQYYRLERSGRIVSGTITSKDFELSWRTSSDKQYVVGLQYHIKGTRYQQQIHISQQDYDELAIGDVVAVRYLAKEPTQATIDGSQKQWRSLASISLIGLIGAILLTTYSIHH